MRFNRKQQTRFAQSLEQTWLLSSRYIFFSFFFFTYKESNRKIHTRTHNFLLNFIKRFCNRFFFRFNFFFKFCVSFLFCLLEQFSFHFFFLLSNFTYSVSLVPPINLFSKSFSIFSFVYFCCVLNALRLMKRLLASQM